MTPSPASPPGPPGATLPAAGAGRDRLAPEPAHAAEAGTPAAAAAAELDAGIVAILAEKVLLAWLRNRYQLLFPFPLDLDRLDEAGRDLVLKAMIVAAEADGQIDPRERARIEAALARMRYGDGDSLKAALAQPESLNQVLGRVHDVENGALVYAAAVMTVDPRRPVNRHFLRYLASRLQLSDELAASLKRRFRSSA